MKRKIGIAAAWIGATAVAVLIASAAVGSVRTHVTETPTPLGSPSAAALAAVPQDGEPAPATAGVVPEPTVPSTTPTTVPDPASASSSTTVPQPPQTSSTTQPAQATTKTYDTAGGSVRIQTSGEQVFFSAAVPNTGWKVEVEDHGPEKVKVKFERNDDSEGEIEFVARFENGELEVTIQTE